MKEASTKEFIKKIYGTAANDEPFCMIWKNGEIAEIIRYPGFAKRAFIRKKLRSYDIEAPEYVLLDNEIEAEKRLKPQNAVNTDVVDHTKLYHQDFESALFQMLKREMFAVETFNEDESTTLKSFLNYLNKVLGIIYEKKNNLVFPCTTFDKSILDKIRR